MSHLLVALPFLLFGCSDADKDACERVAWYMDVDGDGHGPEGTEPEFEACEALSGYAASADDCDDTRADLYPGAPEICGDGVANDCDDWRGETAESLCGPAGEYGVANADARLMGTVEEGFFGNWVAGPGDVNGDGLGDLLVHATHSGDAYLFLGPVWGEVMDSDANGTLENSDEVLWRYGLQSSVGDLDGDGFGDLIVSGDPVGEETEVMMVFAGPISGSLSMDAAAGRLEGEDGDSTGGWRLASPGDTDGDGWPDMLVGAYEMSVSVEDSSVGYCAKEEESEWTELGDEENFGTVYLLQGPLSGSGTMAEAGARLLGEDTEDSAGHALGRIGDWDGDGLSDLAIGASGNCEQGSYAGAVYLITHTPEGDLPLADADVKLMGEDHGVAAGAELIGLDDANGDGLVDLLVGGPGGELATDAEQGFVYLVLGSVSGKHSLAEAQARLVGEGRGSEAGSSLASAGDQDGDGLTDFYVASMDERYPTDGSGVVHLLYGPVSGAIDLSDVSPRFNSAEAFDGFASVIADVGDTDGDGLNDLLVGAYSDDTYASYAGAAYLILAGGAYMPTLVGP